MTCDTEIEIIDEYKSKGQRYFMRVRYTCKKDGHILRERDVPITVEQKENLDLLDKKLRKMLAVFDTKRTSQEDRIQKRRDDPNSLAGRKAKTYTEDENPLFTKNK